VSWSRPPAKASLPSPGPDVDVGAVTAEQYVAVGLAESCPRAADQNVGIAFPVDDVVAGEPDEEGRSRTSKDQIGVVEVLLCRHVGGLNHSVAGVVVVCSKDDVLPTAALLKGCVDGTGSSHHHHRSQRRYRHEDPLACANTSLHCFEPFPLRPAQDVSPSGLHDYLVQRTRTLGKRAHTNAYFYAEVPGNSSAVSAFYGFRNWERKVGSSLPSSRRSRLSTSSYVSRRMISVGIPASTMTTEGRG
jgi:hypothetical protein